uniref:Alcohol dehydrogenase-like C-terminal domain-containing protein n=1 Tax=Ganoderma boninense TaxID=34458 RepID=A0A5K1K179_9APHY|nr:Uncharacterized protein [Ganoderma boninense]
MTCEEEDINGVLRDGGYGEYATLRTEAVVSVPIDIDPYEAAPLLCAGITVFNSLRHMNALPPDVIAVRVSGESKRELSHQLGAHEYVDGSKVDQAAALKKLGGAKVILCTAPNAKVIENLLPGLAVDGTLLLLALEATPITISPMAMIGTRLSIRAWVCGHAVDSEDMLTFAKAHHVKVMVEKFPLDRAPEAYERRSSARFRAVIVPGL